MTRIKTVQNDLDSHGLSWTDAVDLTQNRPLWRLVATSGAMHSYVVQAGDEDDDDVTTTTRRRRNDVRD